MKTGNRIKAKHKLSRSASAKRVEETKEHARLKGSVKEISSTCCFNFDSEVHLNLSGSVDRNGDPIDECSIDVATFGNYKGKSFLIIFECKGGTDMKEIQRKMNSWETVVSKMQQGESKIISSEEGQIEQRNVNKVDDIRVCYVFGKGIDEEKFNGLASSLAARNFYTWDNNAVTYYKKIAKTIGKAAKYQILREFDVNLESEEFFKAQAIRIRQGNIEMFVFGAEPSTLLKIGYVSRRASGLPDAYQRILNKDRIVKISKFVTSRQALLPNAIIIAFDNDPAIQQDVRYENGKIHFPKKYCSAWIIDGQHRVFGFIDTPHEVSNDDGTNEVFELPVVAFKSLDPVIQNRTFVSINYNQKKIDPTLLCDLATSLPDLQNELTWSGLLVTELAKIDPFKNTIKISELDKGKPISISSFSRYGLLEGLLGYDKKKESYNGALYSYSPFDPNTSLQAPANQKALKDQVELLRRYFDAVSQITRRKNAAGDPWRNIKEYSLLKPTGINALLLVLSRILEKYPKAQKDFTTYLAPLKKVRFTRRYVANQGGGWQGFRNLANVILGVINSENGDSLRLFGTKDKR